MLDKEIYMTDTKAFVDSLFDGYEKTGPLAEFMEELAGNFEDKVASDMKKGLSREAAFSKAKSELGDISALAAELSLKARQDVFAERYLGVRSYMSVHRVAAYVVCGTLLAFGLIAAAIVYFTADTRAVNAVLTGEAERMSGVFGTLLLFITAATAGFTFFGLTQETAELYPMRKRRATFYACAAALIAFGFVLFPLVYFATGHSLMEAIATLLPFFLPGAIFLAFLLLTEKNRLKPWAAARMMAEIQRSRQFFDDTTVAVRFGLYSGVIWIFALGVFITLGFVIGFQYSWLSFVFATAVQLAVKGAMTKKSGISAAGAFQAAGEVVPAVNGVRTCAE
jgi:hypothetical protein